MNKPTNDASIETRGQLLEHLAEYERKIRATERRAAAAYLRRRAGVNILEIADALEAGAHFGPLAEYDTPAIATDSRGPVTLRPVTGPDPRD